MTEDSNVVELDVVTTLDIPAERVLRNAAGITTAVVLGYNEDGSFYFASSVADGAEVLWLLKLAEKRLLEIGDPGGT
jgi:hypothetical protein